MLSNYKIAALCIYEIHCEASHELITELNKSLNNIGYRLFIYNSNTDFFHKEDAYKKSSICNLINFDIIDALILSSETIKNVPLTEHLHKKAKKAGIPVIILDENNYNAKSIYFDVKTGFADIVRHVTDTLSMKNILLFADNESDNISNERIEIYKSILKEKNITLLPDSILHCNDNYLSIVENINNMINSNNMPDAIICVNIGIAETVYEILANCDIKVPDDIVLAGFNDKKGILPKHRIISSMCYYGDFANAITKILKQPEIDTETAENYVVKPHLLLPDIYSFSDGYFVNVANYFSEADKFFSSYKENEEIMNNIISNIFNSETLAEASEKLRIPEIRNMKCILKKDCIDETVNPILPHQQEEFGNEFFVFFDSESSDTFIPYKLPEGLISPNLDKDLKSGFPVIFTAITFTNTVLGYTCLCFNNYNIDNYYKISQLTNTLSYALGGFRNIQYQKYITKKMQDISQFDQLTGLYTRNGCKNKLTKLYYEINNNKNLSLTAVMTDLNNLKYINDKFGHTEGDFAIKAVATAMKNVCPNDAVCVRIGGDEMIAFFITDTSKNKIKNEINNYLEDLNSKFNKPYTISTSIGIYSSNPQEKLNFNELITQADKLMYLDKNSHHSSFYVNAHEKFITFECDKL